MPDTFIADLAAESREVIDNSVGWKIDLYPGSSLDLVRRLTLALESVTAPTEDERIEQARADAANDAFVDAVAWARSCSGESADVAADYIQEMYTKGVEV